MVVEVWIEQLKRLQLSMDDFIQVDFDKFTLDELHVLEVQAEKLKLKVTAVQNLINAHLL